MDLQKKRCPPILWRYYENKTMQLHFCVDTLYIDKILLSCVRGFMITRNTIKLLKGAIIINYIINVCTVRLL